MKKEDLIKLGLDEESATKIAEASAEELKGFIPKARFDEVNEANKTIKTDLADRDKQLEDLKKSAGSSDELKKQIEALQTENTTKATEYENTLKQIKIDAAIKEELSGVGVVGDVKVKMVKALLDLQNPELDGDKVKGLGDQLKKLQEGEETKGLFVAGKPALKGFKPGDSGDGKGAVTEPASLGDAVKMHFADTQN